MDRPPLVLVPHTHWDREWYLTFEAFRDRLVAMMDGLIELLDRDPRFAHFHLDGQAAMIDDYLAVRPERDADVRRLAREGRISVGPWFTQMDEFLVSGESLIRNLEWGLARARDLAGVEPADAIGYLPDQFGHVGQMPQILSNAGARRAVVWRGVPSAIDRTTFMWESPDGSSVIAEYLAFGYSLGAFVGRCGTAGELRDALEQARTTLAPYSLRDRLLLTVGTDHESPPVQLPALLQEVGDVDEATAVMGSLAGYLDEPDPGKMPSWRGELRSSARAHLLPNVVSNRAGQKVRRAQAEAALERYAEPLAALVPGFEWPEEQLRQAWRLLLWNGAHDSVCGCGVDEVARAVDERCREAEGLASGIRDHALHSLADGMSRPGWMYFNPSPFERDGVPGLGWRMDIEPTVHPTIEFVHDGQGIDVSRYRVRLVDEGDIGDLYTFCPTPEAPRREPSSCRIRNEMGATRGGRPYPRQMLEAVFDEGLSLELWGMRDPVDQFATVTCKISNARPDHRLRLHLALPDVPAGSVALSAFEVVERPLLGEGGTETPSATWPARGAVMAGGTAVLSDGVFEYEVIPDPPELAITLLRCVGTISRESIATRPWPAGPGMPTPEAQMMGEHVVSFTFRAAVDPEEVPAEWERRHLLMRAVRAPGGGSLPESGSLLAIEGAEVSSVRRVDGELEVRVWNPSRELRSAVVGDRQLDLGAARIETVRLPRHSLHFQ